MIKPLNDRVVVKALHEEKVHSSGIVLPDTVEKEKAERGEVIAVGDGRQLDNGSRAAMSVKVRDKILFKKYSPEEVKLDGQELLILEERDILAVID
jgi:chaperonin GroES